MTHTVRSMCACLQTTAKYDKRIKLWRARKLRQKLGFWLSVLMSVFSNLTSKLSHGITLVGCLKGWTPKLCPPRSSVYILTRSLLCCLTNTWRVLRLDGDRYTKPNWAEQWFRICEVFSKVRLTHKTSRIFETQNFAKGDFANFCVADSYHRHVSHP